MRLLLGMMIVITTSCTEIFKTELLPIKDCAGDSDICSYTDSIQPIFDMYCTRCHGNQGRLDAGLDLTSRFALMSGSVKGQVIVESDSENSILWQRISNESNPMPPVDNPMIHENYINMIAKWIHAGAIDN